MKACLARALTALLAIAVLLALPLPASAAKSGWLFGDYYAGMKRSQIHADLSPVEDKDNMYIGGFQTLGGIPVHELFKFNDKDELVSLTFITFIANGMEGEWARSITRYVESFGKILFHFDSRYNLVTSISASERNRLASTGLYYFWAIDRDVYNAATDNGSNPRSLLYNLKRGARYIEVRVSPNYMEINIMPVSRSDKSPLFKQGLATHYWR